MTCDPRALDYVLGTLSADERATLDRTRLHDAALDRSIEALELDLGALAPAAGVEIGAALWERIATALNLERHEFADVRLQSFASADWAPSGPGIETRTLWTARTQLLRCQPGAADGEHVQDDDEHIVVIAGDLIIAGRVLSTGDHLFFPAGGRHPAMRTLKGCVLLMHYC
jgi:hypothetical protein